MAELIYPTALSWDGPWFLESQKLNVLDELLAEFWPKVQARAEDAFKREVESQVAELAAEGTEAKPEEVEKRMRWRSPKHNKTMTLYFETGKRLEVESFREALLHPQVNSELADSFDHAVIESGDLKAEVRLGVWGTDTLSIEVSPAKDALAVELFGALSNWAASSRPPRWQTRWRRLYQFHWWAYFLLVLILFGSLADNSGKRSAQAEASKLLHDGVSISNETESYRDTSEAFC